MNNLPVSIGPPIKAFRESELTFKVKYPDGFTMPTLISIQFWTGNIYLLSNDAAIEGIYANFTIPLDTISVLPDRSRVYFLHDGEAKYGGDCFVEMGVSENPTPQQINIGLSGDHIYVIEVLGLDLITEQVQIATEKAAEATTQAGISAAGAVTATSKAGEAAGSATAAEAAKDIAVANAVQRIDVATYAAAVPYFTGSQPREVYVAADEGYYEGDASWYKYVPGKGEALLGIDFNYKD